MQGPERCCDFLDHEQQKRLDALVELQIDQAVEDREVVSEQLDLIIESDE